jgi:hypothetical protein
MLKRDDIEEGDDNVVKRYGSGSSAVDDGVDDYWPCGVGSLWVALALGFVEDVISRSFGRGLRRQHTLGYGSHIERRVVYHCNVVSFDGSLCKLYRL